MDELPEVVFPGVTTCKEWADEVARRQGDLLTEEMCRDLELMRAYCQLFAAIRDGRETIGEP